MLSATKAKKAAYSGILAALALIFSYVEAMLPFNFGIPGIKLGLANIVVLIAIYGFGAGYGLLVNLVRMAMAALLFGSGFSFLYALSGGLLSFIVMLLLKKTGYFSMIGVSMGGGFFHNLGQLMMAALLTNTPKIFVYFAVLGLSGIATGIMNGLISTLCISRLKAGNGIGQHRL